MSIRPLALALLLSAFAVAAEDTPRPLLPPSPPPSREVAPTPGAPSPPAIRSRPVPAPSLSTVGLGVPRFGFDGPLWPGAEAERLRVLLDRLPERLALPALRDLARRLLTAPGPRLEDGLTLLLARARVLTRIGDPDLAAELLLTPGDVESRVTRHEAALTALAAARETARACELAADMPGEDVALAAVRIVCALREGNTDLAGLRLELARERGIAFAPDFLAMLEAARAGRPLSVTLPTGPERPAMLLLIARMPVGEALVEGELKADPAVLAALAGNAQTPAAIRLVAAEAAAASGWLSAADLRDVYLQAADPGEETPVAKRAALVTRLAAETVPAARAALLAEAVPALAAGIERLVWLRVLAPYAAMLVPDPALDWAAEAVILPLLAPGETDRVEEWRALLERRVRATGEGKAELGRIERLLALAGRRPLPEPALPPGDRQRLLFATLVDGLGLPLESREWTRLLESETAGAAEAPPLSLWRQLEEAEAEGRPGEELLAALGLVTDAPEGAAPLALWRVLRGLEALGEKEVARAMAVQLALVWRL